MCGLFLLSSLHIVVAYTLDCYAVDSVCWQQLSSTHIIDAKLQRLLKASFTSLPNRAKKILLYPSFLEESFANYVKFMRLQQHYPREKLVVSRISFQYYCFFN